jgi:hypothetical protein
MKAKTAAAVVAALLINFVIGADTIISCPVLTCDAPLDLDQCFLHDDKQPVEIIRTYNCDDYAINSTMISPICELNLPTEKYAWYKESTQ